MRGKDGEVIDEAKGLLNKAYEIHDVFKRKADQEQEEELGDDLKIKEQDGVDEGGEDRGVEEDGGVDVGEDEVKQQAPVVVSQDLPLPPAVANV